MKYLLILFILLSSCIHSGCKSQQQVTNIYINTPSTPSNQFDRFKAPLSDLDSIPTLRSSDIENVERVLRSLPPVVQSWGKRPDININAVQTGKKSPVVQVEGNDNTLDDVGQVNPIDKPKNIENDQTWVIWGIGFVVIAGLIFALIRFKK